MELYKGMEGSPITYLTSDITANQTTISIVDDSALPDGHYHARNMRLYKVTDERRK